jgi:hypothetical protein
MKVPELPKLIDEAMTRRKDRLRTLFALYLLRESAGVEAPGPGGLRDLVPLSDERMRAAVQHLVDGGYITIADGTGASLTHAGIVAIEAALVRIDREAGEFPALRAVLMEGDPKA